MATHPSYSCLENSKDRRACLTTVHMVAKSFFQGKLAVEPTLTLRDVYRSMGPFQSRPYWSRLSLSTGEHGSEWLHFRAGIAIFLLNAAFVSVCTSSRVSLFTSLDDTIICLTFLLFTTVL